MQFTNEFTVPASADTVFNAMLDVRGVANCMPGATIGEEREDGSLEATVAVRVGPIRLTYGGTVAVEDADHSAHTARLRVVAREQRGQGGAEANVTLTISDHEDGAHARMVTDLAVTGRVAQMGAGVMQEVATSMVEQFADCLSARLTPAAGEPAAVSAEPVPAEPAAVEPAGEAAGAPSPAPAPAATTAPPAPAPPQRQQELKALPLLFRAIGARIRHLLRRG